MNEKSSVTSKQELTFGLFLRQGKEQVEAGIGMAPSVLMTNGDTVIIAVIAVPGDGEILASALKTLVRQMQPEYYAVQMLGWGCDAAVYERNVMSGRFSCVKDLPPDDKYEMLTQMLVGRSGKILKSVTLKINRMRDGVEFKELGSGLELMSRFAVSW